MVFPTPQIYTYHIFQHSLFLSQQLNIDKIGLSESFAHSIIRQMITPLLCFKTHLTMLSFFPQHRVFPPFFVCFHHPPHCGILRSRLAPTFDCLGGASHKQN